MTSLADDLRQAGFKGVALVPADGSAYFKAASLYNGAVTERPSVIGICNETSDIQIAVRFATKRALQIGVKSGGHSVVGYALNQKASILIVLSRLNDMTLEKSSNLLSVGPGALWGDVQKHTLIHNLLPITGENPRVGVAGFVLGGGYGYFSRHNGLAADNVVSMHMIDHNGNDQFIDSQNQPDLFWALRGAGANNFGIVSKLTMRVFPVPPKIWGGSLTWKITQAKDIISLFQSVLGQDAGRIGMNLLIFVYQDEPLISLVGAYDGDIQSGQQAMQAFANFGRPHDRMGPISFADMDSYAANTNGAGAFWKSGYSDLDGFPADALDVFVEFAKRMPAEAPLSLLGIEALGGKINTIAEDATSFVHRRALWNVDAFASWPIDQTQLGHSSVSWAREAALSLQPYQSGYVYQNYPDLELGNWQHAYFGSNYQQLLRINKRTDPNQTFGHRQGVGSSYP